MMANIPGVSLKSDLNTIEAPIFSLQKNIDKDQFRWTKGELEVVVTPNKYGRATIWDKDIILYLLGQVAATINRGLIPSRTIRTSQRDILLASKRNDGGGSYKLLKAALRRLRNTSIETNMMVGEFREREEFSLIQGWKTIRCQDGNKTTYIEITLSEWLYQSALSIDLLTYDQEYFGITKALERRLYEIFRRHLGKSSAWKIGEQKLFHKVGGRGNIRRFRSDLKSLEGKITGYRFNYDSANKMIHVYPGKIY